MLFKRDTLSLFTVMAGNSEDYQRIMNFTLINIVYCDIILSQKKRMTINTAFYYFAERVCEGNKYDFSNIINGFPLEQKLLSKVYLNNLQRRKTNLKILQFRSSLFEYAYPILFLLLTTENTSSHFFPFTKNSIVLLFVLTSF